MSYQLQRPHNFPTANKTAPASSSSSSNAVGTNTTQTSSFGTSVVPRGLSLQHPNSTVNNSPANNNTSSSSLAVPSRGGPTTPYSTHNKSTPTIQQNHPTEGIITSTSPYIFPAMLTDVKLNNTAIRLPLTSLPTQPPLLYQGSTTTNKQSAINPTNKMILKDTSDMDIPSGTRGSTPLSPSKSSKSLNNNNTNQSTATTSSLIQPPGYHTTITTTTTSMSEEDEEWNRELAILEAVDNWKKYANDNLPRRFRKVLTSLIERYPGLQRVLLYQVFSYYQWEECWLEKIWLICSRIFDQTELIYNFFEHVSMVYHDFLHNRECQHVFQLLITFLYDLPYFLNDAKEFMPRELMLEKQWHESQVNQAGFEYEVKAAGSFPSVFITEYLTATSKDNQYYLLQLLRHLSRHEYLKLFQYLEELYYVELKHRYQDLLAKFPAPSPEDNPTSPHQSSPHQSSPQLQHHHRGEDSHHSTGEDGGNPILPSFLQPPGDDDGHIEEEHESGYFGGEHQIPSVPSTPFSPSSRQKLRPKTKQQQHRLFLKSKLLIFSIAIQKWLEYCYYVESQLPTTKHCALCRSKRLQSLEFRMVHDQVPSGLSHVPGNVVPLETAKTWQAHDERHFHYDIQLKQVFWQKKVVVNLMEICDHCIVEVHEGLTSRGRFDEIHHYPPAERKQRLFALRQMELELAEGVIVMAETRLARRIREYLLTSFQTQRLGLKSEALRREQDALEAQRQRDAQAAMEAKRVLLEQALVSDKKWVRHDERTAQYDLYKRTHFAHMVRNRPFDPEEALHPSTEREHAKSWKLKQCAPNGMPLTVQAAHALFGTDYIEEKEDEETQLQQWKADAEELVAKLLAEKAAREHKQRQQELVQIQTLKNYVNERTNIIARQHELLHHLAEEMEMNRLLKRQHDKDTRRQQRFAMYLQQERMQLEYEDHRSYLLRGYEFECLRELQEREDMFNAEFDQCEIDRFWGIDAYDQRARNEELRLRQFYEQHVYEMNQRLVIMGSVKGGLRRKDIQLVPIGKLPEDRQYQDDDKLRRMKVIKKLKAEEIRSNLKLRMPTVFY